MKREDGRMWTKALKTALADFSSDRIKKGEALFAIATEVVKDAINSYEATVKVAARKEIFDRLEGKSVQATVSESTQYIVHTDGVVYDEVQEDEVKTH